MTLLYTFEKLLTPLDGTREAKKLAMLSGQVKIEHHLLAEIMFNGNAQFPDLEFFLEQGRRDLTVRARASGTLIDWVEAKMCYTDCLARWKTGRPRADEYARLLLKDADKQRGGIEKFGQADQRAQFTSLLFVIHFIQPVEGWKYDKDRKHCKCAPETIEQFARDYVHDQIAQKIGRNVVEDFTIPLDTNGNCRLLVFVLRAPHGMKQGRS
jgi:hypothetical protein